MQSCLPMKISVECRESGMGEHISHTCQLFHARPRPWQYQRLLPCQLHCTRQTPARGQPKPSRPCIHCTHTRHTILLMHLLSHSLYTYTNQLPRRRSRPSLLCTSVTQLYTVVVIEWTITCLYIIVSNIMYTRLQNDNINYRNNYFTIFKTITIVAKSQL